MHELWLLSSRWYRPAVLWSHASLWFLWTADDGGSEKHSFKSVLKSYTQTIFLPSLLVSLLSLFPLSAVFLPGHCPYVHHLCSRSRKLSVVQLIQCYTRAYVRQTSNFSAPIKIQLHWKAHSSENIYTNACFKYPLNVYHKKVFRRLLDGDLDLWTGHQSC